VIAGGAVVVDARIKNPRGTARAGRGPQGAQSPEGSPGLAGDVLE
jgi:hypothetical protein